MRLLEVGAAAVLGGAAGYFLAKRAASPLGETGSLTVGYWKIRGLAGPLRMMCHYKKQPFVNKAYGTDKEKWFADDKPALAKEKNSLMNLPYVIDGPTVVTQSNSCALYLGQRLGIDAPTYALHNHQVLDETMDLRNNTMKIVYPFNGTVKTKEEFPAAYEGHMKTLAASLGKLEGFCKGPYMCGPAIQSGDFALFEMLDQHMDMCEQTNTAFDFAKFPKLSALHKAIKEDPALASYFASEPYTKYPFNNPCPWMKQGTYFVGKGYGEGPYGDTDAKQVVF